MLALKSIVYRHLLKLGSFLLFAGMFLCYYAISTQLNELNPSGLVVGVESTVGFVLFMAGMVAFLGWWMVRSDEMQRWPE